MPRDNPEAVFGRQLESGRDSVSDTYGTAGTRQLGVTQDRIGVVRKALERGVERQEREAKGKELRFPRQAASTIIDPRGVLDSKPDLDIEKV